MQIRLNGEPYTLESTFDTPATAADLVEQLGLSGRRIAVEINEAIVPKSQLAETRLAEGDEIEIVHAIGGG
ncbi:sulfur carrier protein ThiS [Halomonas llamarensis]|uniref:Sulfur carrier protein ThiS n=1 Tax=Halomonas llamarensis TaxID=2945104 RepID=A0ABT0SLL2_9GAMM|nr:sulfur carrier protein ThiS [Halomonas llamarensis]MCL7928683.1 sulfur carrier protein ThiS [Halomonas llamarensis]